MISTSLHLQVAIKHIPKNKVAEWAEVNKRYMLTNGINVTCVAHNKVKLTYFILKHFSVASHCTIIILL